MLEYRRDCRALCAAGESAELRAHQDCSATPLHALQIQIFTVHVVTSAFFTRAPSGGKKKNPRWFGSAVVSSSFTNRDRTPAENRRTAASATRGGSQAWGCERSVKIKSLETTKIKKSWKVWRARSLLYRSRFLRPNTHFAAFFLKDLILAAKWFNFGC